MNVKSLEVREDKRFGRLESMNSLIYYCYYLFNYLWLKRLKGYYIYGRFGDW